MVCLRLPLNERVVSSLSELETSDEGDFLDK